MSNRLLIEGGAHETRVAVLEEGRLTEVHIERPDERDEVGNIYRGRVSRVLPGIQAAFVDAGLDRDAFLVAGDLQPQRTEAEGVDEEPSVQSRRQSIADVVKQGQELLVQVVKEPLPGKGARITSQITLPGRLLVLLPGAEGVGISRRITDAEERARLEALLEEIRPERAGLIARTAAIKRSKRELEGDLHRLDHSWLELESRSASATAPALLHQELELPLRAVRDLLDPDFEGVWVEGGGTFEKIVRFLQEIDPAAVELVRLHDDEQPLFDKSGAEREIGKAIQSKAWLASGGFIVVSPTEALVAIDVNTGRFTGRNGLEETALQTNLEAATEVARQIRLRNLGGIIVVDFIDMSEPEHRDRVLAAFEAELAKDRTRTQVAGISEFGLVEVTRKRMRGALLQRLTRPCPCCEGRGRVKDAAAVVREMGRELQRRRTELAGRVVRLRAHPALVAALEGDQRASLEEGTGRLDAEIRIEGDPDQLPDGYQVLID